MSEETPDLAAPHGLEQAMAGSMDQDKSLPTPGQAANAPRPVEHEAVTAQDVAVKRDMADVMRQIKALAEASGEDYVYRIPFKDHKTGRTTNAEGPTIKLANDLARIFGNCQVDIREVDEGDAWIFYARFTDLQSGFNITRPFRQRKGQGTGMKDDERRLDSVYQIGASKAIRNVVVNALQTLSDYAVREAKSGLKKRIEGKPEEARKWIRGKLQDMGIAENRVTPVVGRSPDNWTVPDMARLYSEVRSIEDGMAVAEDLYPSADAKPEPEPERPAKPEAAPEPQADPEPEQPPQQAAQQGKDDGVPRATEERSGSTGGWPDESQGADTGSAADDGEGDGLNFGED